MTLEEFLLQLGINVSGSVVYDFLKKRFKISKDIGVDELKKDLASFLNIKNSNVIAEKIINFLAVNGNIEIRESIIFAKDAIFYSSNKGTKFFLEESKSETEKTRINVGKDAKIEGQGGAAIGQNEDGSISFYA